MYLFYNYYCSFSCLFTKSKTPAMLPIAIKSNVIVSERVVANYSSSTKSKSCNQVNFSRIE